MLLLREQMMHLCEGFCIREQSRQTSKDTVLSEKYKECECSETTDKLVNVLQPEVRE